MLFDYPPGDWTYKRWPHAEMKTLAEERVRKESICERCKGDKRTSATNEFMNHDWEDCFKHTYEVAKTIREKADEFANGLLKFGSHQYSCGGFCLCSWSITHMSVMRYQLDRAREEQE